MLTLFVLYKWTIFAGCLAAPALALLGAQLATRERTMQTMCVGQGAMVGVLFGMGALHVLDNELVEKFGPFFSAVAFSALTFLATDVLVARKVASKNTFFAFVFAFLLAMGSLVTALFPALESHMAQVYFGDLATLGILESKVTTVMSLACLGLLVTWSHRISNQSFEWAVFGNLVSTRDDRKAHHGFKLLTLVLLCLSVQFVGFLFTIAMLFLPTALLTFTAQKGLTRHLVLCAVLSSTGTLVGFLLSLQYTRLPTVPAIVAVMFILAMVTLGWDRLSGAVAQIKVSAPAAEH